MFQTVWLLKDIVYVVVRFLIWFGEQRRARGRCGSGSVEEHVRKRMHWMQVGGAYEFEQIRKDGRVIQMRGNPVEGGGFVTTSAAGHYRLPWKWSHAEACPEPNSAASRLSSNWAREQARQSQ